MFASTDYKHIAFIVGFSPLLICSFVHTFILQTFSELFIFHCGAFKNRDARLRDSDSAGV